MKYIKSKLLQRSKGNDRGKYLITLEITDKDINMFEDLAMCQCTVGKKDKNGIQVWDECCELEPKIAKYLMKVWKIMHKPWHEFDLV
jgi:hypothetical protein